MSSFRISVPGILTLPLTAAVLAVAAACSVEPGAAPRAGGPSSGPSTAAASPSASASRRASSGSTPRVPATGTIPIRVVVGGQTLTGELYDNPTARDLASRLPLTLTLDDLHGLEKTGSLPDELTTDGVPRGSDPEVNEIGYYAPGGNLVFYYGDVGYFNGIIRIGRFDADIDLIRDQPDGFSATLELGA